MSAYQMFLVVERYGSGFPLSDQLLGLKDDSGTLLLVSVSKLTLTAHGLRFRISRKSHNYVIRHKHLMVGV